MLKRLFWSGGVATLLLASSLSDFSLAQQPSSFQSTSIKEISTLELQQYASTVKRLQTIEQKAQQQMIEAIKNEDLNPERFKEIGDAYQNPGTQPREPITPEEKQSFERAQARLGQIQQETEVKMQRAVQTEGLEVRRFKEIAAAVRKNPTLQKQFQEMLQN
jgi:hypothetical protein